MLIGPARLLYAHWAGTPAELIGPAPLLSWPAQHHSSYSTCTMYMNTLYFMVLLKVKKKQFIGFPCNSVGRMVLLYYGLGIVPQQLKTAKVIPVFKSGWKDSMDN